MTDKLDLDALGKLCAEEAADPPVITLDRATDGWIIKGSAVAPRFYNAARTALPALIEEVKELAGQVSALVSHEIRLQNAIQTERARVRELEGALRKLRQETAGAPGADGSSALLVPISAWDACMAALAGDTPAREGEDA